MRRAVRTSLAFVVSVAAITALAVVAGPEEARADVQHVIGRGHTIDAIAHRYHVSVKAIMEANGLKDTKHLKPGDTLIIPGVSPKGNGRGANGASSAHGGHPAAGGPHGQQAAPAHGSAQAAPPPPAPAHGGHAQADEHPKHMDVVHAVRLGEEFQIRVKDRRGKIPSPALRSFEKMMRSGNAQHAVDPRLVALVGVVSNHFGGRKIEVVSGYRPFASSQYTPHSNHNFGKALDFRVVGIPNEQLRDFCKTLRNVGCGYYPNSTFVHLDVRESNAYWVDYSRPGEPPRYDRPNASADEGTSDVPDVVTAEPRDTGASIPAAPAEPRPAQTAPAPTAPAPAATGAEVRPAP